MIWNEKQELIINEQEKNIVLIASAGTGKTNTLCERILRLIKDDKAKASEILCITFTNKAAKEMEDRIKKTLGGISGEVKIKTFHGFCYDLIKLKSKSDLGFFRDFIVFDEDDTLEIVKTINNKMLPDYNLHRFINLVKEESMKNNIDYKSALEYVFKEKVSDIDYICTINRYFDKEIKGYLFSEGKEIIDSYNNMLIMNHGLDFNDLITKARELLEDETIVEYLSEKYKYINIDEIQDTSIIEYSIIEKIFKDNNILICGDIFQTIYGWRGSEPLKIINKFIKEYNPIEIIFNKNYRATENLNNAANEYLFKAFGQQVNSIYKEGIVSNSKSEGQAIYLKKTQSVYEEASFIYSEIKSLYDKKKDISKVCILTRNNQCNIELSKELGNIHRGKEAFEFILVDQFKFFRRTEIKDVLAFFKLMRNKHDTLSLKRIIKKFGFKIKPSVISEVEDRNLKEIGILVSDFVDIKTGRGEYFSLLIEDLNKDNIVIFDVETTGVNVDEDEIVQIAAIKIDSKGNVLEKFEKFSAPNKSVGDSFHIHGFSDDFLKENGEEKRKVLRDFIEFSGDSTIVGHNVQFDINIFLSELSRNNMEKVEFNSYDTLDIYRRFYPNLENYKLETLSKIFQTNHFPTHNALDDILATGELLVKALNEKIIPTSFERISYSQNFYLAFKLLREELDNLTSLGDKPHDILAYIINRFNFKNYYSEEKMERLRDFYSFLRDYCSQDEPGKDSILDILKLTALSSGEIENTVISRNNRIRIPIITVHQAKGLEFDTVFLSYLQDGKFPSYSAIKSNNLEEEKRTFYVAITRAKQKLYLTYNTDRGYYKGEKSRFIDYISDKYIKS